MLEIVFSDSAAGSLAISAGPKDTITATVKADSSEKLRWKKAKMLSDTKETVLCFPLALSVGEIDEDGIGPKRGEALALLMRTYPEIAAESTRTFLETARASHKTLLDQAADGEPVRVWVSGAPDEACGFYWLTDQLRPIGFENLDITYVKLPDFTERPNGTAEHYRCWGEIAPWQWVDLAGRGKKLPLSLIQAMANHWKQLQKENAPLRAVLNGQLASVPETIYDPFIFQEIAAQSTEFPESMVVGAVLNRCPGVSDGWIAMRIEQFIRDGLLTPVTAAEPEHPYRRILRKRRSQKPDERVRFTAQAATPPHGNR